MDLMTVVAREPVPAPWSEGEKIPWNEPDFSQRMLAQHLSQAHDAASRRLEIIEKHVAWINVELLSSTPGKILDLGCGPGLYASRLAKLGHRCVGIDFSPASIAHARQIALADSLNCTYLEADLRKAAFGEAYDLAMLIYGEFNVFRPQEARQILEKAWQALKPGGRLLLEVSPAEAIRQTGKEPPSWYSASTGLFSERPHLVLMENFWDEDAKAATERYFIIDGQSGDVRRFAATSQAYTDDELVNLLQSCGFSGIRTDLTWELPEHQRSLLQLVAGYHGA